jgi:uncharacterized protein YidB (DUF937 family)
VKLQTILRNAGRGQALAVWVELLEFGGISGYELPGAISMVFYLVHRIRNGVRFEDQQ